MGTITAGTPARFRKIEIEHKGPGYYGGGQVLIGDEIELGGDLATATRLTSSKDDLPGMLARDPAGVFRRFNYGRSIDQFGEVVIRPSRDLDELPVGNEHILTPSNQAWPAFLEVLRKFSTAHDYPGRTDHHGWSTCNWGAAMALFAMGYAVAESLAVFMLAGAGTDDCIHYNLGETWSAARVSKVAARRAQVLGRRRRK